MLPTLVGVHKWVTFLEKSFLDNDFDFTFVKQFEGEVIRFKPSIITMYLLYVQHAGVYLTVALDQKRWSYYGLNY